MRRKLNEREQQLILNYVVNHQMTEDDRHPTEVIEGDFGEDQEAYCYAIAAYHKIVANVPRKTVSRLP